MEKTFGTNDSSDQPTNWPNITNNEILLQTKFSKCSFFWFNKGQ